MEGGLDNVAREVDTEKFRLPGRQELSSQIAVKVTMLKFKRYREDQLAW